MAIGSKEPVEKRIERVENERIRSILRAGVKLSERDEHIYDFYTPQAVGHIADYVLELEEKLKEIQ